jgi:hypothetical protein
MRSGRRCTALLARPRRSSFPRRVRLRVVPERAHQRQRCGWKSKRLCCLVNQNPETRPWPSPRTPSSRGNTEPYGDFALVYPGCLCHHRHSPPMGWRPGLSGPISARCGSGARSCLCRFATGPRRGGKPRVPQFTGGAVKDRPSRAGLEKEMTMGQPHPR